jgi:hypothetical protein
MKTALSVVVVFLLGAAPVRAQTQEWADKLFAKGGTTHNFGNVPRGALLSHDFTMTNIYAVPLEIIGTRPSCNCVTVKPSKMVLQPKETITVSITMDARRFTGAKTVPIFISVGPQYTSTATLQVTANSRTDVVFNPGQVNFGVAASGDTPTQTIEIEYIGTLDWKITGIAEHSYPFTTKLEELYRGNDQRQGSQVVQVGYRLSITLKSDAPVGTHRWELLLQTNDPGSPSLPVLVEATIQAPLSVVPNPVALGTLKAGEEVSRRVLVRGSKAFRIVSVEMEEGDVTVDFPGTSALVQVVTVKWKPVAAGDLRREIKIKTDLESTATTTMIVEGKATQ